LDAATKSKILQIESLVQMRQQRQQAFLQLMSGDVNTLPVLVFKIRREHVIEDTLTEISQYPPEDLKKELRVHFVGEEGIDEGGVKKEFFQLIVREIFGAEFGMFVHEQRTRSYWFSSESTDFLEFELIGKILGLAIYNAIILDVHFPLVVYKKVMNIKPKLQDLKEMSPDLALNLHKMLEADDVSSWGLDFQITYQTPFGEVRSHELKPHAADIPVTNDNRKEYVDLYVKYLLEDSISKQFNAFLKGFKTVCNSPALQLFRPDELQLLICGSPVLDFEALERVTLYDNGYSKDHPVIKNFWDVVHHMSLEQRKRLLFFTTGSDRSPIGGLAKLYFVITRHGPDSDRLPQSHTCFNHLLLPEYKTKEKLHERLLAAIENAEGFGML
jgi:hypothetical protein